MPGQPSSAPDLPLAQALKQELERAREARRQADELRDRTVAELSRARARCADRLGSLSRELAEIRRYDQADVGAEALLERTLGFAMSLREIIDDVRHDVVAISIATVPGPSGAESTSPANGSAAATDATDGGDPDAFWLSGVLLHVPRTIVASMLQAVDIGVVNSIAVRRPELLGTLVSALSAADAAQWLPRWNDEAAARVLSTVAPDVTAGCLEEMSGELAITVLTAMPGREGARVLVALAPEVASRLMSGMDPMMAVRLLQRLEPEEAAEHLLRMEELGLAKHGLFVPLMTADMGERCLRAMDKKRSERTEAVDLIRQIERNSPTK